MKKSSGVSAFVDSWDARCMAASTQFSAIAESLRRVRAKLIHPDEGDPARSVLITSAGQGEGKSFVSANLGVIMAQSVGRHALLVDTDLRRPTLSNLFGADNSKGLVDYLRDGRALSELLVPSGMPRLSLLPAGEPPVNPAELITSEKMATMVAELQSRYEDRLILFDSPPVSVASETQVLAQHVDKVVVVVRWGGEGREGINKMIEQLGREKVLGVVFNAFKPTLLDSKSREGDGYYNYYAQSY
ncbi:MAG: polysaccharide biosynthesis tyrosine autokinase [Thermodesulfobacteriota bacterium]